jgi:hypothetical protein
LRHPSFTVVMQKRKKRQFASPVRNVGSLNLLEPSGPVKACNGIALPLPLLFLFLLLLAQQK